MTYTKLLALSYKVVKSYEKADGEIVSIHQCTNVKYSGIYYSRREQPYYDDTTKVTIVWMIYGKRCDNANQIMKAIKNL